MSQNNITFPNESEKWIDLSKCKLIATSATAPTITGSTISATIPGGASTPDPGDAIWAVFEYRDATGQQMRTGDGVNPLMTFRLEEVTVPSLTSQSYVVMGLCNAADLNSSAYMWGFNYASSNKTGGAKRINSGTVSTDTAATLTSTETIAITSNSWLRHTIPTFKNSMCFFNKTTGLPIGVQVTLQNGQGSPAFISQTLYLCIGFGRSANTAGDVTIAVRASHNSYLIKTSEG